MSGPSLKDAFARGVQFKGGVAIDCELSTTPACFFATVANGELGPGVRRVRDAHGESFTV